jgi:hypothetical protein
VGTSMSSSSKRRRWSRNSSSSGNGCAEIIVECATKPLLEFCGVLGYKVTPFGDSKLDIACFGEVSEWSMVPDSKSGVAQVT